MSAEREESEVRVNSNLLYFSLSKVSSIGVEIAVEGQARIFDKFYRTPNHDPWEHSGVDLELTY